MLAQKMFENHDWECHSRPGRRCASYAVLARAAGFDPLSGTLIGETTLRV